MKSPNNIFLIGPMGAGKTTVGMQLAKHLGKRFLDSDSEIEERTGVKISLIFELEGEAGFRKREKAMIEELTGKDQLVLATGGGAVLDADNRAFLMSRGFVIYLNVPIDILVERTSRNRNRPLLEVEDPRARIIEIMEQRESIYREMADMIVTTDERGVRHVVTTIENRLATL